MATAWIRPKLDKLRRDSIEAARQRDYAILCDVALNPHSFHRKPKPIEGLDLSKRTLYATPRAPAPVGKGKRTAVAKCYGDGRRRRMGLSWDSYAAPEAPRLIRK